MISEHILRSIQSFDLTWYQWALIGFSTIFMGISKAGLSSANLFTVLLLAWIFGGKLSTGIVLPLLIFGDVIAVLYFKRQTHWHLLFKLLPWVVVGILAGAWLGKELNEVVFKKTMAAIVLLSVITMIYFERKPQQTISQSPIFSSLMGFGTGFTSMIGNQAGGFASVFFLTTRISKQYFIGTNAWLFMLVNLLKLPFHVFSWKTVNTDTLSVDLILIPFVVIGFYIGNRIVKIMNEHYFRRFIIGLTAFGTLLILFDL